MEASRLKIKATHAAADHIRHVAEQVKRRDAALLTPGSPIAEEVTGVGRGLGSRIMSPSGGLMLPFLNRQRNDFRREIES